MASNKILLVDDDPHYPTIWSYLLRSSGYDVVVARCGEEALTMADHERPDLAIVDVLLPEIDVIELCRRLKTSESTSSMFIMLTTGKVVSPEDQAASLDAGADDFVLRPIENKHLLARVGSMFRVIHAQESLKRELSQTLQRLKQHTENTPLAVIEFNHTYQIISWSKSAERIFGWTADEVLGKAIKDFPWVVEDDRELVAKLSDEMSNGIRGSNLNINRNYRKDGSIITCEWHNSVLMDGAGMLVSVLSFVQDVTEQKNAEHQLRESQTRLDLALKGAYQGVWDWSMKTGELIVDERWAEILGYSLNEVTPYSVEQWIQICNPEDAGIRDEALKRHLAKETDAYICELRLKHKRGNWVWVMARGKVMEWDAHGDPVRVVGTIVDISEAKKLEAERERLLAELKEALTHIKTLSGLIPICSSCKKIRDDQGYWNILEQYLTEHSDARFTHGLCPDCMKKYFPSLYDGTSAE